MKFIHTWCILGCSCVALLSCDQSEKAPEGPTPEELAERQAEERALREAQREEREAARREKVMEEMRQKELARTKAREEAKQRKAEREQAAAEAKAEAAKSEEGSDIDWEAWEDKMVMRLGSRGMDLGTVRTVRGKVFREAVVQGATAKALTLYHSKGVDEIPYGDLQGNLQEKFLFDAEERAMLAAGGEPPNLRGEVYHRVKERVEMAQRASLDEALANEEPPAGETALERRRRLANEVNQQRVRLTRMKEAGSREVGDQQRLVAQLEQQLKTAAQEVIRQRKAQVR